MRWPNIATLIGAALEQSLTCILNVADPQAPSALHIPPFALDTAAADQLRDVPAVRYEDTIITICDWLVTQRDKDWRCCFPVLAAYPMALFDYAAEDRFSA